MTEPVSARVLYALQGRVHRGWIIEAEDGVVLTAHGGTTVPVSPGLVLLEPPDLTEPEVRLLDGAVAAGYRVEAP